MGSSARVTLSDALEVFDGTDDPGEPLTASEVAESLDCSRRTAYDKLDALAERGDLNSKKTGARGRVWWRPVGHLGVRASRGATLDQAQFEELVEAVTNYAIFALDADGNVVTWNEGAQHIKGYDEADIVGEHFSTFYTEEETEAGVPEANLAAAKENGYTEDEGWRVQENGEYFWANVTITALRDDEGELEGFIKVTRDMTEEREHEQALRQEKERFESLVQEVEDYAIFMLDSDGNVQSWNEGAQHIKGYDEADILGEHFSTFYTEEERKEGVPGDNLAAATEEGRVEDEGWRVREDGTAFWANVVITALHDDDGELRGYAKVTRDMTEQHEYEERLLEQRDELDELNQINADIRDIDKAIVTASTREEIEKRVCDRIATSGSYTASWIAEYTPDHEELASRVSAGVDGEFLDAIANADGDDRAVEWELGSRALRTRTVQTAADSDDAPEAFELVAAIPLVYNDVEYGALVVYSDDDTAFDERKTAVLGELGETISHAIAAVKRKERERTLTDLHESTRELLHAETAEDIGEIVVSTATDDLELTGALVYDFDTTENVLGPLTVSPGIEAVDGPPRLFTPGDDSAVWATFVDGETAIVDAADDAVLPTGGALGLQEAMIVPLGDHGVLVVGSTDVGTFDSNTRKLVELLASTAQAALNRVESEANLRERDSALQEQNRRLQRLNQLNTVVRDVDQRLVGATTREEIQRDVCEVLTTIDRFRLAWIGTHDATNGVLVPLTWNGTGRGYLDSVSLNGDDRTTDPAVRAARTGEIAVVSNVADDLRAAPWRKEAFSREFQSVVAVPLSYGDHEYGVLVVYADRPGMFGEMEQSVFAELGYTIAHAINTVEMKQALFADRVTELELRLPPDVDNVLPQLARRTESRIEFEGIVPAADGKVRLYFTARDGPSDEVLDALEGSTAVESGRLIAERDDGSLFEAVVSGRVIAALLIDHNASLRALAATSDGVHLTIDLPSSVNVREFVERFQQECPGAEFVARREHDRSIETPEGFRSQLEASLTDRQLEVLETAYYSGFFESPRGSTGGDIADTLDVSQPTVTGHLRAAQRKLLDLVLDDRNPPS